MTTFREPSLKRLPMLEPRRRAMETCVYCPKLCRSACPVSNAEPRETIIPWGKMSTAYFVARGDVPMDESFAAPAWACTDCHACAGACDHRNDVAGTLMDARDAFHANGVAPAAAKRVSENFGTHRAETSRAIELLQSTSISAGKSLLIGCSYAKNLPDVASDAMRVANKMFGEVKVERECCGLPLRLAGDARGFREHAKKYFTNRDLVVVDPGCAVALRDADVGARVTLLVEHVAENVSALREGSGERAIRYHDPCQLGRGLGIYDAPRTVLTRVLGRAPLEFSSRREHGSCSGAGGLLPLTMPDTSRKIATTLREEHEALARTDGAREIVTGCASSARRLDATDWITLVAKSI